MNNSIGCIIVNYNTPIIISRAVNSVKKYVDKIIIIDGSDSNNESYKECDLLKSKNTNVDVIHTNKNVGHGPGLNLGIKSCDTKFILCMDSDAVLKDPSLINEMKNLLINYDNIYGCGYIVNVDDFGNTVINNKNSIKYLHPYFCMFKKSNFLKYEPFINHGAPFIKTMKQLKNKNIPISGIKNISKRCWHEHRRTRNVIGQGKWGNNWTKP